MTHIAHSSRLRDREQCGLDFAFLLRRFDGSWSKTATRTNLFSTSRIPNVALKTDSVSYRKTRHLFALYVLYIRLDVPLPRTDTSSHREFLSIVSYPAYCSSLVLTPVSHECNPMSMSAIGTCQDD